MGLRWRTHQEKTKQVQGVHAGGAGDACGGGDAVDIDDLRSLADGLREETQCVGSEQLVLTTPPEWCWCGKIKEPMTRF